MRCPEHSHSGGVKQPTQQSKAARAAPVGVAPEDVSNDHHSLLDHVVDLLLDEVQQHVDAALCCPLQRHRAAPDCPDRLPGEDDTSACRPFRISMSATKWVL